MKNLIKLLEWAKSYKMTEREREAQRRSFAFGNANLHNPDVTRELVDQVADSQTLEDIKTLSEKYGKKRFTSLNITTYLNIEEDEDCYVVWSSPHKNYDTAGTTFCCEFNKIDGSRNSNKYLSGVYKNALSLWPVHNEERAAEIEVCFRRELRCCAREHVVAEELKRDSNSKS